MGWTFTTDTTPLGTASPGGPATTRVIDAHQHYWRFGEADQSAWRTAARRAIERDYVPADLAPERGLRRGRHRVDAIGRRAG